MADEMKVLREKVNAAYSALLRQGLDNEAEALVEAMTRAERAARQAAEPASDVPAPSALPADAALMNEIELYMEANANVSEQCADFLDRITRERVNQLNVVAQPAWEYSFIHSSATGRGDEKVGPCLTYDRRQAYGVGCSDQRPVTVCIPPASTAG
jgi:hypothetical protein